jgi:hypothetical protein
MNKSLRKWLVAHDACKSGVDSLLALHITDARDAYNRAAPEYLIWTVTQDGVMTQRKCVQFALFCVRQVAPLLTDDRSRAVIPALEGWLDGSITQGQIVRAAAYAAYAADAANAAARAVAYAAYAADAARKQQAEWIRANIPFESLNLEDKKS